MYYPHSNVRRLAGIVAVMATTAGGLVAASPAGAATGPTATLTSGTVTVTGTAARDVVHVTIDANRLVVDFGFDGTVDARFNRPGVQRLSVLGNAGDDGISVDGSGVGDLPITMSGGAGNDFVGVVGNIGDFGDGDALVTLNGNLGNDDFLAAAPGPVTIHGGAGDDFVDGGGAGTGQETISLGDGNDRFKSLINGFIVGGTRSDIVDGGAGQNSMEMDGAFASESVSLSASAGHLIVDHDQRGRIDSDNIQDVKWVGFGGLDDGGGGDAVAVNDLSSTDVTHFTPDFTDPLDHAGPNNSADQLTVRGTAGVDRITVSGSGPNITVAGLTATVTPVNLDAHDTLRIETLAGADIVDSSGLQRGLVQLQVL
jgi:hypothetical protein